MIQTHVCKLARELSPILGQSSAAWAFPSPQQHTVYTRSMYTWCCKVGNPPATDDRAIKMTVSWQVRVCGLTYPSVSIPKLITAPESTAKTSWLNCILKCLYTQKCFFAFIFCDRGVSKNYEPHQFIFADCENPTGRVKSPHNRHRSCANPGAQH